MNVKRMTGILVALMAAVPFANGAEQLKPKALVIMLDGMRADAVENAWAPNLRMLCSGTWQPGYKGAYSLTANTILDAPSVSAPNHTSIATGVTATKTNVRNNGEFKKGNFAQWPSWLSRLVAARPEMKALYMFSWKPDEELNPNPKVTFVHGTDFANGEAIPKRLAAPDGPDATLFFIDLPDHGGHSFGYYPYTVGYLNTVYDSDKIIGGCLKAIAARPTFAQEDWLIIVTADHGGYLRGHGIMHGQATSVPLIIAGRNVSQGRIPGTPHNYDAAPTALAHFGLDVAQMDLDGQVRGKETVTDTPRPLKEGLAIYLPFNDKTLADARSQSLKAEAFGKAAAGTGGGFIGNCLRIPADTNTASGVILKGSEKLAFENGSEFAITMWVRMPAPQQGDPPLIANKDWKDGGKPGIALVASKRIDGAKVPGVAFNTALSDNRKRLDLGPYDIEFGKWAFYAVSRSKDGPLRFYQGDAAGNFYWISEDAKPIVFATGMPFHIGQDGTGKYPYTFAGDIDDFALWTRPLLTGEIRAIYDAGRKGLELKEVLNLQ